MNHPEPTPPPLPQPAAFSAFELKAGVVYEVTTPFEDFDGVTYPAGDRWEFLSQNFFPYDAGLTLYVRRAGSGEGTIRLQDYDEAQGRIIGRFSEYVRRV